jgi:cyclohexa-1,5-dienecarbonyl-CoA hydratase
MSPLILHERLHGGAIARLVLSAPPGNILDIPMIDALAREVETLRSAAGLKAILLEGSGSTFSYGASVEDHRPAKVRTMLASFHGLFRALAGVDRTLVAAVRGRCLGGGMELACFCHRVFASPEAIFAQPEINLGVFAPVASIILARRAGQPVADEVCLTGRAFTANEALAARLVDEVAIDPRQAAEEWIVRQILPKSAAALQRAVRAVRLQWNAAFLRDLAETERIYLDDLMRTEDAVEGIEAFLGKRPAAWKDR